MFLRISCSCVMNKVAVMAMISTRVTTCTLVMPLAKPTLRKVSEIRAPKIVAWLSEVSRSGLTTSQWPRGNAARGTIEHPKQGKEDGNLEQQRQA